MASTTFPAGDAWGPPPWAARSATAPSLAEPAATPLVPADYLDVFAPLRAGADLRGRVVVGRPRDRATPPPS